MTMPCCLYAGDADPLYPKSQRCAQRIPRATFFPAPGQDHGGAFRESTLVLPHVIKFLATASESRGGARSGASTTLLPSRP